MTGPTRPGIEVDFGTVVLDEGDWRMITGVARAKVPDAKMVKTPENFIVMM